VLSTLVLDIRTSRSVSSYLTKFWHGSTYFILVCSCTKIMGNVVMPIALVAICLLGLVVWGHHMLIVGLEVDSLGYF